VDPRSPVRSRRGAPLLALGILLCLVAAWLVRSGARESGPVRARTPPPLEEPARAEARRLDPASRVPTEAPAPAVADAPVTRTEAATERATAAAPRPPDSLRIEVDVIRFDGSPAVDVPVALEILEPSVEPRVSSSRVVIQSSGPPRSGPGTRTDGHGHARLELPVLATTMAHPRQNLRTRTELRGEPEVDLDAWLANPLPLRLPPAGALRVRVLDARGEPVDGGAGVRALLGPGFPQKAMVDVREGLASFPWIELGTTIELVGRYTVHGGEVRTTEAALGHDGETREVTLQLGPRWPEITFRAVDAAGAPLARTGLRVLVRQEPLTAQTVAKDTDDEGRFTFLHYGTAEPRYRRTLEVATQSAPARVARLDLSRLEAEGITDLGDLRLEAEGARLLAAGIVRDGHGPVADATVQLDGPSRARSEHHQVRTDADGRFEIVGLEQKGPFRLTASASGHLSEELVVAPGTSEAVLVLREAAPLLIDAQPPNWSWEANVHLRGEGQDFTSRLFGSPLLPPGTYDVELTTAQGYALERFPGVLVAPGAAPDPRLNPLDLRTVATLLSLRLVDEEGHGLSDLDVVVVAGDEPAQARTGSTGGLRLLLPKRWNEIEIHPSGRTPVTALAVETVQELASRPR